MCSTVNGICAAWIEDHPRCYPALMQPEQRIIANWIERTRERLGWSYAEWARRAGIKAGTTITRALKDDYDSITSVQTLHALAKAADEPSILDFLSGKSDVAEPTLPIPNEETLSALLAAVLPLARRGRQSEQSLQVVAAALARGLEILGDQAPTGDNAGALGAAARGAVARFRDLTQQ